MSIYKIVLVIVVILVSFNLYAKEGCITNLDIPIVFEKETIKSCINTNRVKYLFREPFKKLLNGQNVPLYISSRPILNCEDLGDNIKNKNGVSPKQRYALEVYNIYCTILSSVSHTLKPVIYTVSDFNFQKLDFFTVMVISGISSEEQSKILEDASNGLTLLDYQKQGRIEIVEKKR